MKTPRPFPGNTFYSIATFLIVQAFFLSVDTIAGPQQISSAGECAAYAISSLVLQHDRPYEWRYTWQFPSSSPSSYSPAPFYSWLLGDTVRLSWSYEGRSSVHYTSLLYYSLDSAKSWNLITSLTDTSLRSYRWALPNFASTGFYSFFKLELNSSDSIIAKAVTEYPVVLTSTLAFLSQRWSRGSSIFDPYSSVSSPRRRAPALLWGQYPGNNIMLLLPEGIVSGNGTPLPDSLFSWYNFNWNTHAFGDLNSDGIPEIISDGSAYDLTDESVQIADLYGNGKKEVVFSDGSTIYIYNYGSGEPNTFVSGGYNNNHCAIADFNHDGRKELAFNDRRVNQVVMATAQGVVLKTFDMPEQPLTWTMAEQFDSTEAYTILAAGSHHLYAFNEDGTTRKGFPLYIDETIYDRCPAIADINNDGRLEIVLLAASKQNGVQFTKVYVIDGDGKVVAPWPATVNLNYDYPARFTNLDASPVEIKKNSLPVYGVFASPLIASIDGDTSLEIILTSNNGFLYVFDANATLRSGYPVYIGCDGLENGVLGDFDKNGTLNFAIHSFSAPSFTSRAICLDFGPGSYSSNRLPWPMHLQNPERTGIAPRPSDAVTRIITEWKRSPDQFALAQNYPNPFNASTIIPYAVAGSGHVRLCVYDLLGRTVATLVDDVREPGIYSVHFDASQFSSGVYLYRLEAGASSFTKKLILQK